MYSKMLEPKINQMFSDIGERVSDIIETSSSRNDASGQIALLVGSETATRSKTMISDMYTALSKQILDSINDMAKQNRFYEANLRQEILDKYSFSVPNGVMNFKEANCVFTSLAAGAGTVVVGGLLIYALSPAAPTLPIALVVAASVSAFCISYFKVTPNLNKANFKAAITKYLQEVKASYIAWFDEVEHYFNRRSDEIRRSI